MYPSNYDDDGCTAAPGVMGWTSCRRYPGCGCSGSDSNEAEDFNISQQKYNEANKLSFETKSDWHIRTFFKIETLSKGFYRIWLDKKQYAENDQYFPAKVDGNKLIFHKSVVKSNLKEFFTVRSK